MTERENFLIAYHHGKPAWMPNFYDAYAPVGASVLNNQGDYMKGGKDMFGAKWICTKDTGWQAIPDPSYHVLDDITQWKKYIEFPDLDSMDWENAAKRDLAHVDRKEKIVACFGMEGNFNRLQSLMGTCEALIALLEEPEAVYEFFEAYTRFKMKTIEKIARYYQPDIYVNGDDVCSGSGLFFSKSIYDQLIKPFEIMLGKTAVNCGLIVEHHVCGKAEAIIPDIIETGATIWQTGQVMNDLNKIKAEYGDRLLIPMADRAGVPVVVHFDHGLDRNECIRALQLGFTSVMYDCSTAPYDENMDRVKEMASIAHAYNATIEAELGHVGNNDNDQDPSSYYTDPIQAKEYAEYTGIDALAIAVGTAHGAYKFPPKLDFARIEKIASLMDTPLVLHGGSGLSDEDFKKAIRAGISKVNIFTDINGAYAKAAERELKMGHTVGTEMMNGLTEAVKAETEKKLTLFGW